MKSKILCQKIIAELIYFESEDVNFFEPFSSDLKTIAYDPDNDKSWFTVDPSVSDKPLTVVIDAEVDKTGQYTGKVKGCYLFAFSINELKTYEGDHDYNAEELEFFAFDQPMAGIIAETPNTIEDVAFHYQEGFKEKLISLICA